MKTDWKEYRRQVKQRKQKRDEKIERYRAENRASPTRSELKFAELLKSVSRKYRLHWTTQRVWARKSGGFYLIDFFIHQPYRIAFEIDGSSHDNKEAYDAKRDDDMMSAGILVVRIRNEQLDDEYDRVLEMVCSSLDNRLDVSRKYFEKRLASQHKKRTKNRH